jgi:tetratricopeptide (TPR) repeat protein
MSARANSYFIFSCSFFLLLLRPSVYSQRDAHLDSLENAIQCAEGTEKADLMIKSIDYQWEISRTIGFVDFVNGSRSIYQYSKSISYKWGMAEAAKFLAHGFGNLKEPDSSRYYLSESLRLYIEINDSINIGRMYGLYASTERVDGNYKQALNYAEKLIEIAIAMNSTELQFGVYNIYSEIYKETGEFSKEEAAIKKMLDLQVSNHINPAREYIDLARYHINHGNYKEGIRYSMMADSAIGQLVDVNILEYHDRAFMQAKMKGMVARAYRLWGYYDSALVWYRRSISGIEATKDYSKVDIPNQWEGIGAVYTQWGMYDSARYYLEKSASARKVAGDSLGVGESFDGLGYMYWIIGDQENAVNYYQKAVEIKSRAVFKAVWRITSLKESKSVSYLRLGQAYASWNMPESALREFEKSIELCREIGYSKGEAEVLTELGKLNDAQGKQELSVQNFSQALQIFLDIEFKPGQANVLTSYGDLYYSKGDYSKALDYYQQAEHLLEESGNLIDLADVLHHIGLVFAKTGRYQEAITLLNRSIEQAAKIKLFRTVMDGNKAIADVLEASGKNKEALRHYEIYVAMKDSINRQNTYYQLADLESKYQAELDQKQVVLLSEEARLKELSLNWSKAILLGTVGLILILILLSVLLLRVNRLKSARSLAMIQQRLFRSRMNPEFIFQSLDNIRYFVEKSENTKAVDYLSGFSRLMQNILEGSRKEFVLLDKAVAMVKNYMELQGLKSNGSVEYHVELDDSLDPDETMIPPMMIQPLLEEIIVPQFAEANVKRHLKIRFRNNGPTILIIVETDWVNADSYVLQSKEPASFHLIRDRLKIM